MTGHIKRFVFSAFLASLPGGPWIQAAEFEVLDRFSVDGYSVLKGSADIPGGSFTVGGSTFVVNGGNVGIGTIGPNYKLDVAGSTIGSETIPSPLAVLYKRYNDATVDNRGAGPSLVFSHGVISSAFAKSAEITSPTEDSAGLSRAVGLGFWTSATDANRAEVMRILGSGKVGIGTAAPGEKLTVTGAGTAYVAGITTDGASQRGLIIRNSQSATTSGGTGPSIYVQNTSGTANNFASLAFAGTGTSIGYISGQIIDHANSYGNLVFTTRGSDGWNDRVIITSTGNVGIGTANPQSALHVGGAVQIGDDAAACVSAKAGSLRWHGGAIQVCNGSNWNNIYQPPPSINSVNITSGAGGQTVTVAGANFLSGMTAALGGTSVTVSNLTSESFTYSSPNSALNVPQNLVVTNTDGQTATSLSAWTRTTAVLTVFSYTGADQTFVAPAGGPQLTIKVWGAGGGGSGSYGGSGAFVTGVYSITAGTTLKIVVGQGGDNGSSPTYGGGGFSGTWYSQTRSGGGLSGIFATTSQVFSGGAPQAGASVDTVLLVAGGGGGGAFDSAGHAGITQGENGYAFGHPEEYGYGGTWNGPGTLTGSGGAYAPNASYYSVVGSAGSLFKGGNNNAGTQPDGGGGGSGFYGGGCGANGATVGGGGGGSSFYRTTQTMPAGVSYVSGASGTAGGASGAAPNTGDADYTGGAGAGNSAGNGGNGLIVIRY